MFQNLQAMWQDSVGRKRILFIVGVGLGVILLVAIIIRVNFGGTTTTDNTNNTTANITGNVGYKTDVTTKSFDSNQILQQIDSSAFGSNNITFSGSGQPIYINKDYKLRILNSDAPNSPTFANPTIFNSSEGVILNELNRTTIYLPTNNFKPISKNYSLVQYFSVNNGNLSTKWNYLSFSNNNQYVVKESANLSFSSETTLATITPSFEAKIAELVNFNQKIYFIAWGSVNKQGAMEIWQIKDSTNPSTKIFSKPDVQSISYGPDSLLVTTFSTKPTELTLYQNTWLDFKLNPSGNPTDLQTDFNLSQAKIFGSLLAQRCAIDFGGKAYCLIKDKKVPESSFVSKDNIIKIDLRLNTVTKIQESLSISADAIKLDSTGSIYIISQENRLLYKVKTN